mmetsp:Transcript_23803/g.68570  ORF Transcript_23803/g.68570 Transcript_23803/m.68570 type:complete len:353 (-) Transcript_23803:605-1663(-)
MVRHAKELAEVDTALLFPQLLHQPRCELHRSLVVGGNEDLTFRHLSRNGAGRGTMPNIVSKDGLDHRVVVRLGVLVCLADRRLDAPRFGFLPFRDHVGAAHDLGTEAPALALRALQVPHDALMHSLEVCLVGLEDHRLLSLVVLALQEDHQVVDGWLYVDPLGIDHDSHAELLSEIHDRLHPPAGREVQSQLVVIERSAVQRSLLEAIPDQVVDIREPHGLGPVQEGDDAVLICVDLIESAPERCLILHFEEPPSSCAKRLPIQVEPKVDAVVRCSSVGRGVSILTQPSIQPCQLHQTRGHTLQKHRIAEPGQLDSREAFGSGVFHCAHSIHEDVGVGVADLLTTVLILPRA